MIQAFGLIFGLDRLPDLINPGDYDDLVVKENPINIYSIGSPKANRWTGLLLDAFFKRLEPRIEYKADPTSTDLRNIRVMIEIGKRTYLPHDFSTEEPSRFGRDFGVLVRGPNPFSPGHMMMTMAGRSALGTEAVCRVATEPNYISKIKRRLRDEGIDLSDHKQGFYVVVSLERDTDPNGTYEPILSSLRIDEVHGFRNK